MKSGKPENDVRALHTSMTIGILPRKGHVRYFRGQVGSLRGEQVDDADDDKTSEQTPPSDLGTLKSRSLARPRRGNLSLSLVAVSLCGRSHTLAWRRRTDIRSGRGGRRPIWSPSASNDLSPPAPPAPLRPSVRAAPSLQTHSTLSDSFSRR